MGSRIKVKWWPGRGIRVVVRTDDLHDIGEANFYRSLEEVGLTRAMVIGVPVLSKSAPYTVTIHFDEGRTENGAPGTEVTHA